MPVFLMENTIFQRKKYISCEKEASTQQRRFSFYALKYVLFKISNIPFKDNIQIYLNHFSRLCR